MPLINTRYVSGPLDVEVYRAAAEAQMPAVVISSFDGACWVRRWRGGAWRLRTAGRCETCSFGSGPPF